MLKKKKLKKAIIKEIKESVMFHQIEILIERQNYKKKNKMETLELKRRATEMKNLLEDLNIKSELVEERISKHEDKSIEIKQSEEQREIG